MTNYFDMTRFEGLARTSYYIDGSTVGSRLANYTTTPDGVSADSNLNTRGGKITLTSESPSSPAFVEFPAQFGNTSDSIRAASLEVFGLSSSTIAPTSLSLEIYRSGVRHASVWDASGFGLRSQESSGVEDSSLYKAGNFAGFTADAGVFCDFETRIISGQFGGCFNSHQKAAIQGLYKARISLHGSSSSVVSFRQLKLTLVWNAPGDSLQQIL